MEFIVANQKQPADIKTAKQGFWHSFCKYPLRQYQKWCLLVLASFFLIQPLHAQEQGICTMIYGNGWGAVTPVPEGWNTLCGAKAPEGIALIMWPQGEVLGKASAHIYITVTDKENKSLQQFAEDELATFRKDSPNLKASSLEPIPMTQDRAALARNLSGDTLNNFERIAYVDLNTAYFMVVLTTKDEQKRQQLQPVLDSFAAALLPMTVVEAK